MEEMRIGQDITTVTSRIVIVLHAERTAGTDTGTITTDRIGIMKIGIPRETTRIEEEVILNTGEMKPETEMCFKI